MKSGERKLIGAETWERLLREWTQCHDAVPDIEPYDELCRCPLPDRRSYDGRVAIEMGNSSMRVQYRRTPEGIELNFGDSVGSAALDPTHQVRTSIPTAFIPDTLMFLGGIEGQQVDAIISPYHEVPLVQGVSARSLVDEDLEQFIIRTQQAGRSYEDEGEGQAG